MFYSTLSLLILSILLHFLVAYILYNYKWWFISIHIGKVAQKDMIYACHCKTIQVQHLGRSHQSPTLGAHTHGFWVGMSGYGCDIIVHGWASVLCIPASNFKSESNFPDARNMLTKKHSELKSRQWTTFYLSDPTKTWYRWVIHITQILSTWAQFE